MNGPIVVGTDGSSTAEIAISEAIAMATTSGQPLHIVCAYKPGASIKVPAEFQAAVNPLNEVETILAGAASRARSAGVDVETYALTGDPAESIIETAEQVGAGLIVIGNKGISSKKRFVLGNVPSRVVHHAPCSTYIVHTS